MPDEYDDDEDTIRSQEYKYADGIVEHKDDNDQQLRSNESKEEK